MSFRNYLVMVVVACLVIGTGGSAKAQTVAGGYTCTGSQLLSHNNSTEITHRTLTCALPTSLGHYFDLAQEGLGDTVLSLCCVDFTLWSTSSLSGTTLFVRVWLDADPDNTPAPTLGGSSIRGPSLADGILLRETSVYVPPSAEGVDSLVMGRSDGDLSVTFDPPVLLPRNAVFWIEVGHTEMNGVVRFGANQAGETGDGASPPAGYRKTWVKSPRCGGGGLLADDWVRWDDFAPSNSRDFVLQAHLVPADPEQQIADLQTKIMDLETEGVLNKGQANGFLRNLQAALDSIARNRLNAACDQLLNFVEKVEDYIEEGILTPGQGQPLIDSAQSIRIALGC